MMMISLMIIVLGVVFCTAVDVTVKGPSSEICEDETTRQLPVLITTTQTIIVNDTLKPNDGKPDADCLFFRYTNLTCGYSWIILIAAFTWVVKLHAVDSNACWGI